MVDGGIEHGILMMFYYSTVNETCIEVEYSIYSSSIKVWTIVTIVPKEFTMVSPYLLWYEISIHSKVKQSCYGFDLRKIQLFGGIIRTVVVP